jgi:hypothetical protein
MPDQHKPERPTISPEAEAALPAFVQLLRKLSDEEARAEVTWERWEALGREHGLTGSQLAEAYVFASLAWAHELGGDKAMEKVRRMLLRAHDEISRREGSGE